MKAQNGEPKFGADDLRIVSLLRASLASTKRPRFAIRLPTHSRQWMLHRKTGFSWMLSLSYEWIDQSIRSKALLLILVVGACCAPRCWLPRSACEDLINHLW